jgi:hypothetical protein
LPRLINGKAFAATSDFAHGGAVYGKDRTEFAYRESTAVDVPPSPLMHQLWCLARQEWTLLGF